MNVKFKWMNGTKIDGDSVKKLLMVNVKQDNRVSVVHIVCYDKKFYYRIGNKIYPKNGYASIETTMNFVEKLFGLTKGDFIKPAKRPRPMVTGKSSKK